MVRILLAVCLFITSTALWAAEGTPPSYRYFQSEIPAAFRKQVKAYVATSLWQHPHLLRMSLRSEEAKTPYQKQTADFLQMVKEEGGEQRAWHERFIKTFRSLTEGEQEPSNALSRDIAAFLDTFSIWLFSEVDLSDAYLAAFERETGLKPIQDQSNFKIEQLLNKVYEEHRHNPKYVGYDKENYLTETMLEGNMPQIVTRLDNRAKKVNVVRTGTMVRDLRIDWTFQTPPSMVMSAEFKFYLIALGKKGKKHLYVNLMRHGRYESKKHDLEVQRSALIEGLEVDPAVQNTVRVITLDKNSEFYYQEGPYSDLTDADQFRRQFFSHLTMEAPHGKYYWSRQLDSKRWKETLQTIVEEVHKRHFGKKPELTALERSGFIELAYLKIVEAATQQLDVDVANIACRFCIDRGASLSGLIYYDQLLKQSTVSGKDLSRMMAYVFGPALFFHDRPIHEYRVDFLQSAAAAAGY